MSVTCRLLSTAVVVLSITACNTLADNKSAWLSDWGAASAGVVSPGNAIEVAPAKVARLDPDDEVAAEQWLLQRGQHSALLSEMSDAIATSTLTELKRGRGEDIGSIACSVDASGDRGDCTDARGGVRRARYDSEVAEHHSVYDTLTISSDVQ